MRWMTPEERLTSGLCTLAYMHTHRHTIVYAHNTLRMKMTLNKAANAQFQNLTSNRWLPPREHTVLSSTVLRPASPGKRGSCLS